jgi:hypothetical protein
LNQACEPLQFEGRSPFLSYRDATFDPQTFDLQVPSSSLFYYSQAYS